MFFSLCIFHKEQCNGKDAMSIPNEPPNAQFSPQCVGPSVRPSLRPSVTLYFFLFFAVLGPAAPAQMIG